MTDAWYKAVGPRAKVTQGDLIFDCPLVGWAPDVPRLTGVSEIERLQAATQVLAADVVVLTQACDLEHGKVSNVILCPHLALADYRVAWNEEMARRAQNPSDKAWRAHCNDIRDGYAWNLTMLSERDSGGMHIDHRIVDFHEVYTVPRIFLQSLLHRRKRHRLQLRAPYREHLSQAFARFFMRVGLPVAVDDVWSTRSSSGTNP